MSVWSTTHSPSPLRLPFSPPAAVSASPHSTHRFAAPRPCISRRPRPSTRPSTIPFCQLRTQQHRQSARQHSASLSLEACPSPNRLTQPLLAAARPPFSPSPSPALAPLLFTPTVTPQPPCAHQPLKPMTSQSPLASIATDAEGRNHSHSDGASPGCDVTSPGCDVTGDVTGDASDPQAKALRLRGMVAVAKKLLSEWLGTLLLIALVIGSGIMGEMLASGNVAIALLANTLATVWGLYILIEVFGPFSGAHFNPVVSTVMAIRGALSKNLLVPYIVVQLFGAICGAWLANIMFGQSVIQFSTKIRPGITQWVSEAVATFGLLLVILRGPSAKVSSMVGAYIGSAYWFTASTSFANPAAVVGRMFSNTFAGIAPQSAPGFIVAEIIGGALAMGVNFILELDWPHETNKAVVVEDVGSSRDLENGQGHTIGPL